QTLVVSRLTEAAVAAVARSEVEEGVAVPRDVSRDQRPEEGAAGRVQLDPATARCLGFDARIAAEQAWPWARVCEDQLVEQIAGRRAGSALMDAETRGGAGRRLRWVVGDQPRRRQMVERKRLIDPRDGRRHCEGRSKKRQDQNLHRRR